MELELKLNWHTNYNYNYDNNGKGHHDRRRHAFSVELDVEELSQITSPSLRSSLPPVVNHRRCEELQRPIVPGDLSFFSPSPRNPPPPSSESSSL
ncbi:hypothetical protein L484_015180 [Morus notabilis]|uniref:Uncharacterized protein n=1 Tax=Morus notabilis TaxID=981085 RepID=W9SDL7_9ROSA|nr:hypothetical protein L484_015180 [Morus notabilis]